MNSSSSSSSNSHSDSIDYEQILKYLGNEANLPTSGLPKQWSVKTIGERKLKTIDPKRVDEIKFINSTEGGHAVTKELIEMYDKEQLIIKDSRGEFQVPCFTSGYYVPLKDLEADHAQAKTEIFKRQLRFISKLNSEPEYAKRVMGQPDISDFIKFKDGAYRGVIPPLNNRCQK